MESFPLLFQSRRSPVIGFGSMVAASQPLAVAAGLHVLRQGGNAADAAVAAAAALAVTEPASTGIGGDCFALYYQAATRRVFALNGSGRSPAALTLERVQPAVQQNRLPSNHPYTVTVPGACAGWCDLLARFGHLSLDRDLAPAIHLAEEGFPVGPVTALGWQVGLETLRRSPGGLELSLEGRAPRAGEIFRNPGLARTLRVVASGGKEAFYGGEIAAAIARTVQEAGGCLQASDLAAHTSTWEHPIQVVYRPEKDGGIRVWECPPNGQGLAALLALNVLEGFDLASMPPLSTQRLHLEIEAMRLGFADARGYVADPLFSPAPLQALLSKEYAAGRRALIDPRRASLNLPRGIPPTSSDTVYLSVVDAEGNACSFINSLYHGFGSGIVPSGWGFALQNRGLNFNLDPEHPNALAPGKRPYHTIIPAMATHAGDEVLYACFGVMGGFMQPQGHLQVLLGLLDDGLDPQAALDRPRFCLEVDKAGRPLALEEGIPPEVVGELAALGHPVRVVEGSGRSLFGRGQIIRRDRHTGVLWGGSDPRADGCAMILPR
jgi:gamma-glutamyltranspeptidase/glutathione hydrolase